MNFRESIEFPPKSTKTVIETRKVSGGVKGDADFRRLEECLMFVDAQLVRKEEPLSKRRLLKSTMPHP